jgi:hypothetical protein
MLITLFSHDFLFGLNIEVVIDCLHRLLVVIGLERYTMELEMKTALACGSAALSMVLVKILKLPRLISSTNESPKKLAKEYGIKQSASKIASQTDKRIHLQRVKYGSQMVFVYLSYELVSVWIDNEICFTNRLWLFFAFHFFITSLMQIKNINNSTEYEFMWKRDIVTYDTVHSFLMCFPYMILPFNSCYIDDGFFAMVFYSSIFLIITLQCYMVYQATRVERISRIGSMIKNRVA